MKTLRKGEKFKRLKNSTKTDLGVIKKLVKDGWTFCDKTTWRELRDGNAEKD